MRIVQVCIDQFLDLLTRCVQEPALAQSLGSYTRLSLQERERWLSETVGETLHVDPAQINALRMYSSTTDFAKGVAKHIHSALYEEYVEMEAMQPYAVRRDGNAVCLPTRIFFFCREMRVPCDGYTPGPKSN